MHNLWVTQRLEEAGAPRGNSLAVLAQYGLPPMCVEGQTPDSPQHVKAAFAHLMKVAAERNMFQLNVNSSSALAARWDKRMGE